MDRQQGRVGHHLLEHFHRVVADHPHVGESLALDGIQQAAHARTVDLDGDEIDFRILLGDGEGRLAHAGADLQDERRVARRMQLGGGERDPVLGIELVERAFLRRRGPALAQDVAADGTLQAALDEIVPSVGELGEAE